MAFLAEACFGVYTMFYCWSCYTMVSGSRNYQVTNSHLWGKFFIRGFVFLVCHEWQFSSLIRENIFLPICAIILWCRHYRDIADYFSSFIYPVPIIMWPQIHGGGPNWSKIWCVFKWRSQIKVNSVSHLFEQRHKIWSKCSLCCWWRAQYQLFHWNYLLLVLLTFK